MSGGLLMSRRIRRTPYTTRIEDCGVKGFTVVNHMLLPKAFEPSVEDDYWHLREHVQLWDVSTQRQVEIKGPDAAWLVQWMTPRDLGNSQIGDCLYVPLVDEHGGLVNDPVLLKLADDRFWLSIADSDVLLWAKGLARGAGLEVEIMEPDVSPLAIQGPKAEALMAEVFGNAIKSIGFFKFSWFEFQGSQQLIARSGYSKQGGFEIYLDGGQLGEALWDRLWKAGQDFGIRAGCPNLIERIEGGLLSYGNEFTLENNPLECGLEQFCDLESSADFMSRDALAAIASQGISRQMRGVTFDGPPSPACAIPWPVLDTDRVVGEITSGIWSPRLQKNIGLAIIDQSSWAAGHAVQVRIADGSIRDGQITMLPFA